MRSSQFIDFTMLCQKENKSTTLLKKEDFQGTLTHCRFIVSDDTEAFFRPWAVLKLQSLQRCQLFRLES